jgi:hypothetical protein
MSCDAFAGVALLSFGIGPIAPPPPQGQSLPHTFDPIFEYSFDCTQTIDSTTDVVSYVASLPAGAHTICLLPGTYTLNSTINVPSNTILQGLHQGSSRSDTLLRLASNANAIAVYINGKDNVALKHLKIDGNGAFQTGNPDPSIVRIIASSNILIEDVELARSARLVIATSSSNDVTIASNYIHDVDLQHNPEAVAAIWTSRTSPSHPDSEFIKIIDNYVVGEGNGPGGDGSIDCYNSTDVVVANNRIDHAGPSAIYTGPDGCQNYTVKDNYIYDAGEWGIDVTHGASHVVVDNNYIDGTYYAAMVLWQVNDVDVTNNVMLNGHTRGSDVPCATIVVDSSTQVDIDSSNTSDSSPLYCNR